MIYTNIILTAVNNIPPYQTGMRHLCISISISVMFRSQYHSQRNAAETLTCNDNYNRNVRVSQHPIICRFNRILYSVRKMFCIRKTGYYIFNKSSSFIPEMQCSDVLCVWKLKVNLSLCTS